MKEPGASSARWIVSGRVQGVGFRWFVSRSASRLGIRGWVRNLPDRRVEIVGHGSAEALTAFDLDIRAGPLLAAVENVEKSDVTAEVKPLNSFEIR